MLPGMSTGCPMARYALGTSGSPGRRHGLLLAVNAHPPAAVLLDLGDVVRDVVDDPRRGARREAPQYLAQTVVSTSRFANA